MRRTGEPMTLSLPPFTKAVTWLLGINTAFYLLKLLSGLVFGELLVRGFLLQYLALTPSLFSMGGSGNSPLTAFSISSSGIGSGT